MLMADKADLQQISKVITMESCHRSIAPQHQAKHRAYLGPSAGWLCDCGDVLQSIDGLPGLLRPSSRRVPA